MRRFLILGFLFSVILSASISQEAFADSYPSRPVQMIISIPAGGGGDVNARIILDEFIKVLGQPVVPTNKPGASDTVGADALAKSKNVSSVVSRQAQRLVMNKKK